MRFSEFDDFWLPTTLSSICSFRKKRKSSIKKFYVSTENILQNYKGIEQYNSNEVISGVEFLTGDILMANIRPYLKKVYMAEFDGVSNSDVLIFKSDMVDSNFLHCILANDNFINYVMNSVKGSKMPRGDKIHIMNYHLSIPKAKEQEKIAKFIDLIDQRIDTQSKIIEDLELFKNRISYQIFFELNGENIVSLGEIASIYQPETISQFDFKNDGPFNVYGANGIIGKYDKYNHEESEILLSCRGNCGTINMSMPKSWINGNAMVIHVKTANINKKFMYYYLQNINFKALISGSGVPQITRKPVENIKVKIPFKDKQIFITNIMDCIYLKIKKEKDILELYKKQKAYLLKNMFI